MPESAVALVTGGSRGIGRAICVRLASMGFLVGINYVANPAAAEETERLVKEMGGQSFLSRFDVADAGEVQDAIKLLLEEHGRVDVLVNNAGITRDGLLAQMKEDD